MSLSPEYAAGFLDGEGTICLTFGGTRTVHRPHGHLHLKVSIANTHLGVLRQFHADFGGSLSEDILWRSRLGLAAPRTNHKPFHCWQIAGANAAAFLHVVERHVIVKREQVALGLEFWEYRQTPKEDRCSLSLTATGGTVWKATPAALAKESEFKARMNALNERGNARRLAP